MNLQNKGAVVTGAASGLGFATCKILAAAGAKVVGLDRDEAKLATLASELGAGGIVRSVDVADEASVQAGIDAAVQAFGTIHVAVNCAGVADSATPNSRGPPLPLATWSKVIAVNLPGPFNVNLF